MLIQMPRGPGDPRRPQSTDAATAFESGLRHDLSSGPLISYDAVIGGWPKRIFDLGLTILAAPLWAPAFAVAAIVARRRNGKGQIFAARDVVGYGGHRIRTRTLRLQRPTATVTRLRVTGGDDEAPTEASGPAPWRIALEHAPLLWNVLRGEMSLVGPAALTPEQLDQLKGARRHYLSARPGLFDVHTLAGDEDAKYKAYALSWSLTDDVLILWDAIRSLNANGAPPA